MRLAWVAIATLTLPVVLATGNTVAAPPTSSPNQKTKSAFERFNGKLGLQLYSLRFEFKKNGVGPTLDWVQAHGFRLLEGGDSYGMPRDQFNEEVKKRGMRIVGIGAAFEKLRDNVDEVIANAKAYGCEHIMCAWIPHQGQFTEADVKSAADVFNRAGKRIKEAGMQLTYHPHGYEFVPTGSGTLFDDLAAKTDPKALAFEIDVFWAKHGGADPAALIEKYHNRVTHLHLKDLKNGVTGNLTGSAPDETSVALGTGQIDWPAVLKAAKKAGVRGYYIEEESPEAPANIPLSLDYLARVKF